MELEVPVGAAEQASKFSADDVVQHLLVKRQIGDDVPELAVLLLELG
jgi:hypothetical protein